MQIPLIEVCRFSQTPPVGEAYLPTFTADQPLSLQSFQRPIDMHRSKAERIGKLLLCHGQVIAVIFGEPLRIKADRKLAKKVRSARPGVVAAYVEHPLTKDRSFDKNGD